MKYIYQKSFIGGSFDHLHIGHYKLIHSAFNDSNFVTIGLTSDEMIRYKRFAKSLENYDNRYQKLFNYLNRYSYTNKYKIIKLTDIYGSTVNNKDSQAIYVTQDTKPNAILINQQRTKLGLQELEVVEVDFVKGDDGQIVSSERIRGGEINSNGESYLKYFEGFNKDLLLPKDLRQELVNPFGEIVQNIDSIQHRIEQTDFLVTVGDIVSADFIKHKHQSSISVIDLKTRRQKIDKYYFQEHFASLPKNHLPNPAGMIKYTTALSIQKHIQEFLKVGKKQIIVIIGEEDLLALPFILFSPLGSIIIYGIYDKGMALVEVTFEKKEKVKQLMSRFTG